MIIFTQRLNPIPDARVNMNLLLSAEERQRSRFRCHAKSGEEVELRLPRGTVLRDSDILYGDGEHVARVLARPEPVLTVSASDPHLLLRAAYHLGNRHVPLEITSEYLRLSPDPVLADMLRRLHLQVIEEVLPFHPELGAYHGHAHEPRLIHGHER